MNSKLFHHLLLIVVAGILFPGTGLALEVHEAEVTPWSGYWWPYYSGALATGQGYRGHPAPLEKYELFTQGLSPLAAVSWYKRNYYDSSAPGWYGLCAQWAWAAVYEPYQFFPSSEDNMVFRVGDKKGLLTLAHTDDLKETGSASDPDEFHYWLLHYIKDQGKAFVADIDSGREVWSHPIFRYEMERTVKDNVESVNVLIYYVSDFVHPDYRGSEIRYKRYTYDLYLEGDAIVGGEWTGDSIEDHPVRLTFPLAQNSEWPDLDYDLLVGLAQSRDDFLEQGEAVVSLAAGAYHLVLMDRDIYEIDCQPGDIFSLSVEKEAGSEENIEMVITDGTGNEIRRTLLEEDNLPDSLTLTCDNPPYRIYLSQSNYASDPNIYTISLDIEKEYRKAIPYVPKSGGWSGFAITNPGQSPANVSLTTYTEAGKPIHTVFGPARMEPNQRRVFLFDDLPVRTHEKQETEQLILASDMPVKLLNLHTTGSKGTMGAFVQGDAWIQPQTRILPDTVPAMTPGYNLFGGIINRSFEPSEFSLAVYEPEGAMFSQKTLTLPSKESFRITPGRSPFYNMPNEGWIEIRLENGTADFDVYQYLNAPNGMESLFALPGDAADKIVPHVPPPGYWETDVTLINPTDQGNQVRLHLALAGADAGEDMEIYLNPREKRVINLGQIYGKFQTDPLYHSIVAIKGTHPIAGYYRYSAPQDQVCLPLMDSRDFKSELVLPHYPGDDGHWWTGAGICNPFSADLTVKAEPYDNQGNNLMTPKILNLKAGEYTVFMVADRFPEQSSKIAFVKFRVQGNEGGYIGGFYLYGRFPDNRMLSGANM